MVGRPHARPVSGAPTFATGPTAPWAASRDATRHLVKVLLRAGARHRRATKPPRGFGAAEATCPVAFASGPARNVVRTSYTASASCLRLRLVGRLAVAPRNGAAHRSASEPGCQPLRARLDRSRLRSVRVID
jgi:hypothetical protein